MLVCFGPALEILSRNAALNKLGNSWVNERCLSHRCYNSFYFWLREEFLIRALSVCLCLGSLGGDVCQLPSSQRAGGGCEGEMHSMPSLQCWDEAVRTHQRSFPSVLPKNFLPCHSCRLQSFLKPWDRFCFWCLLSLPVVFWFSQNWWGSSSLMLLKLLKVFSQMLLRGAVPAAWCAWLTRKPQTPGQPWRGRGVCGLEFAHE